MLPGTTFELDYRAFFYSDESLDIALVGIKPASLSSEPLTAFSHLRLIPGLGKILVGHPINIIQHPEGGPKHYGVRNNTLHMPANDTDLFLTYTTDTLQGSSGSPVLNRDYELIAVHRAGVPGLGGLTPAAYAQQLTATTKTAKVTAGL